MEEKVSSSLSQSVSWEEMAEFWDEHDAADFHDKTHPVDITFDIRRRHHYVAIDPSLLEQLREVAAARGLHTESLVNLWLQERLLLDEVPS